MRIFKLATFALATTALSLAPAYAQGRGGSHAAPPVTHGNPHTTTSPTTTTSGASTTTTPTSSSSTTTSGSTPTSTSTTLNPIAAKISSHPQLASRLTSLLPTGMTLNQASSGFRNQGQFIAALHVSKNLNIPFTQLKNTMLGITSTSTAPSTPSTLGTSSATTTSTTPMSLGQAIHTLRPSANSTTQANLATKQASTDLSTSGTTSNTTTTTTATGTSSTTTSTAPTTSTKKNGK